MSTAVDFTRRVTVTDSTNLIEVWYAPFEHIMQVTFTSGDVYQYDNVSAGEFSDIVVAPSVGKKFAQLKQTCYWTVKKVSV